MDILDIAISSVLFLSFKEKVLVRKELDSEGDFAYFLVRDFLLL